MITHFVTWLRCFASLLLIATSSISSPTAGLTKRVNHVRGYTVPSEGFANEIKGSYGCLGTLGGYALVQPMEKWEGSKPRLQPQERLPSGMPNDLGLSRVGLQKQIAIQQPVCIGAVGVQHIRKASRTCPCTLLHTCLCTPWGEGETADCLSVCVCVCRGSPALQVQPFRLKL